MIKIRSLLSLLLLSNSVLLYEILVVRIYSVFYLSNNLFLIFSLALLGIGIGGIIAYYYPPENKIPGYIIFLGYSLSLISCLVYITNYYYYLPAEINVIITAVPFIFAGYIISCLYWLGSSNANHVFLYDLIGGAIGCLLSLPLVEFFGFSNALAAIVIISTIPSLLFFYEERKKFFISLAGFGLISFLMIFFVYNNTLKVGIKSLSKASTPIGWMLNYQRMKSKLIDTRWDVYSRVDLLESAGDLTSKTMYINGGTEATMLKKIDNREEELNKQNNDLLYFPYKFDKNDNVLVLGAGGGRDVHLVLLAGAKHVVAVEINKGVVDLTNKNKEYTGDIFNRPEVETVVEDGRTFVMRDRRKYDRIVLSLASTYAFSGISSISQMENYLYTKEAFEYYFERLNDNGTITIFIDFKELMDKFVIAALSYFEDKGISPFKGMTHIIVVGNPQIYFIGYSYAIIIRKTPYTASDMNEILRYSYGADFQNIILPYKEFSEKYEPLAMGRMNLAKFIASSETNIRPPTDDNPYFLEVVMNFRYKLFFLAISIALVIFILWSLYYQRLLSHELVDADAGRRFSYMRFNFLVPYVTLSGIGSMLIEITFIKIFSYYLGYPQLNMAIILFSLLIGFGLGSLWAKKFQKDIFKKISMLCLVLSILLIFITSVNNYFLRYTIDLPLIIRIILVVIYLFPITFIMGIPFPTAIRTLEKHLDAEVPWLWGINGVSAVLGSVLSVIISMVIGIKFTLYIGVIIYLGIALLAYLLSKQNLL
ncbi:hypothetical protein HZA55_06840 [Candidatus Poribacteria bacterium]|nr:hypothetical protein [Candidatus Poribacteria bacterium]